MIVSGLQMVVDLFQSVVTTAAILAGAVWAYYKFVKGRTFKSSLDAGIVGEATRDGGDIYLLSTLTVKNIGASKVDIKRRHTALRVLAASGDPSSGAFEVIEFEHLATKFALEFHSHLEPGETATDTHFFRVSDSGQVAFKLEAYVASDKNDLWFGVGIVNLTPKSDN